MPVWRMIIVIVPAPMAKPDNVISKMMKIMTKKIMTKMMSMMKMKTGMKTSEGSMIRRIMTMKIMMMRMTKTTMKMKGIEEVVIEM